MRLTTKDRMDGCCGSTSMTDITIAFKPLQSLCLNRFLALNQFNLSYTRNFRILILIMHSIQCSSKEKMKIFFEECYQTMEETKETISDSYNWLLIGIIIGITLAVIAVIIGIIVLVIRKQSPKPNRNESSIESQRSSKQSDSLDEIARNLKPGQKFRVLRFKSEVLEKDMLSQKK